ncbi:MAG: hypothetical protein HY814_02100, partial [Candidatus Riflebacteria bacterium]|nr:hypothetical protein [Candidatus Riflebacteria bacterium]
SFRMRGLSLSPGRNRLTVSIPGLAPQELDIVVLDRAAAAARLAVANQQLGQWNRTQAPSLVARSAASADYLAGEIAGLLERPRLSAMMAKRCLDDLESLAGVSRRLLGGKTAWDGQAGLLDCAHRSTLDGTLQPYSLFVPAAPSPGTTRPLLVALPDTNETPSAFLASLELQEAALEHGFMVLSPFGRGLGTSYRGPSEVDVSEALNEVLALFPVDRARIYVAGSETGGTAALELGLQSPDLFRGLGAVNAVGDELSAFAREWRKEPVAWLASLLESRSALPRARNAAGMALFLRSQPDDTGKALQDNLPRDLTEAGATLWDGKQIAARTALPGLWEPMLTFFDANTRPRPTATISFTSSRLSRNTAWWVRAETARVHGLDYAIRAERSSDGLFHADVQNLTAFDLSVAGTALASGSKALLTVDGQSLEAQVPGDGWLRLRHAAESWSVAGSEPATTALRKRPGVEGPIEHAFMRPFLYVYSDAGPDAGVAEQVARESARQWEQQYNGKVTIVPESKLTRKDEQERNLVLFGFPGSSPRLASVLSAVPARITTMAIEVGQTSFNGRALGLQMVRPNPAAPDRYVVAVTGNSPAGLVLLAGHDWRKPDYLVVGPGYVEDTPQSALGGGFFDLKWQP